MRVLGKSDVEESTSGNSSTRAFVLYGGPRKIEFPFPF